MWIMFLSIILQRFRHQDNWMTRNYNRNISHWISSPTSQLWKQQIIMNRESFRYQWRWLRGLISTLSYLFPCVFAQKIDSDAQMSSDANGSDQSKIDSKPAQVQFCRSLGLILFSRCNIFEKLGLEIFILRNYSLTNNLNLPASCITETLTG